MLMGTGKLTAQIATDGKYLLHIEPEGAGSGKAVALPRAVLQKLGTRGAAPPRPPGPACRDVSLHEHGAFPRLLGPSPWLAGIPQAVPAFCESRLPGRGHRPQPRWCQPGRGTDSERLEEQRVEAGAEPEPGGAHPKCCQGMSHDVIAAEGEGRCVGPRSGDTITAMSSCVRTQSL